MRQRMILIFWLLSVFVFPRFCLANNLSIDNVDLTSQDSTSETIVVEFDISWDNSWRNPINHDAVWIFVRYQNLSGSVWKPATLYDPSGNQNPMINPTGYSTGSGTPIDIVVPADFSGCFIQRSYFGAGSVDTDDIQLIWDWGEDDQLGGTAVGIQVFGIEMVYVPEASFYIGDGDGYSESTNAFHAPDPTSAQITAALTTTISVDANLYDDATLAGGIGIDGNGGIDGDDSHTIGDHADDNALFPTGYEAFYIMKYEITEGSYVDMLNSISPTESAARFPDEYGNNRHTIDLSAQTYTTDREDRACSYLNWSDVCAFCDWSCLRPMTETEFEKAARGGLSSIYSEYAWGDTVVSQAQTISGTENGTEYISYPEDANASYGRGTFSGGDAGSGALRSGIFARSTTNRHQSGASFYGVMELSGNLEEQTVTLGEASGRQYDGSHGDGELITSGTGVGCAGNVESDWPGYFSGSGVLTAQGSGLRGGSNQSATTALLGISNRTNASLENNNRLLGKGGRCVRSAPNLSSEE